MANRSLHVRNLLNTVLVVSGGVLIGGAIHQSFVVGSISPTAPITVLMVVLGVILAAVGYRFRVSPDTVRDRLTPDEPGADDESNYDPSLSPLGSEEPSDENT